MDNRLARRLRQFLLLFEVGSGEDLFEPRVGADGRDEIDPGLLQIHQRLIGQNHADVHAAGRLQKEFQVAGDQPLKLVDDEVNLLPLGSDRLGGAQQGIERQAAHLGAGGRAERGGEMKVHHLGRAKHIGEVDGVFDDRFRESCRWP